MPTRSQLALTCCRTGLPTLLSSWPPDAAVVAASRRCFRAIMRDGVISRSRHRVKNCLCETDDAAHSRSCTSVILKREMLLLLATLCAVALAACPSGWLEIINDGSEIGDSCIQTFGATSLSWTAANADCVSKGGHLFTLQSNAAKASNTWFLAAVASAEGAYTCTFAVLCSWDR